MPEPADVKESYALQNGNPIVPTTGGNDAVVGGNIPAIDTQEVLINLAANAQMVDTSGALLSVYQWNYYRGMRAGLNLVSNNPYGDNAISASQYHALLQSQGLEGLIGLGRLFNGRR